MLHHVIAAIPHGAPVAQEDSVAQGCARAGHDDLGLFRESTARRCTDARKLATRYKQLPQGNATAPHCHSAGLLSLKYLFCHPYRPPAKVTLIWPGYARGTHLWLGWQEMVGQAVFVSVDAEATPVNQMFANEMQIRQGWHCGLLTQTPSP